MKTIKLYDLYPYNDQFESEVIFIEKKDQLYDVLLKETLFFPEEGGQNCDLGTLNGVEVVDVQIKDGIIHHYTKELVEGKVVGKIDFARRYDHMQNHSGEHVFSGIVHSMYGYTNVGFHLGETEMTVDFDGFLTIEQLDEIEKIVNEVIIKDIPIECFYIEDSTEYEYRSKKEINDAIRLVKIEGVDICACCAPHVHSTNEIGLFKVLKAIKYKKGVRVFLACGKRAYEDYVLKHDECVKISKLVSLPPVEISGGVEKLLEEISSLKNELISLKKQQIINECSSLDYSHHHILFIETMDSSLLKDYINLLLDKSETYAAVFMGSDQHYRFMIGSKLDARNILNQLKVKFTVKGGGKADSVQGTIEASKEEIMAQLG